MKASIISLFSLNLSYKEPYHTHRRFLSLGHAESLFFNATPPMSASNEHLYVSELAWGQMKKPF